MASEVKKIFDEFNVKLVRHLPLKDAFFLAELTQQNLFSGNLKEEVMTAPTQKDATTCFLDEAIKPSLDVGNREAFDKLLLVMQKSDYQMVNKLAEKIKQKLSSIPEIRTSTSANADLRKSSSSEQCTTSEDVTNQKKKSSQEQGCFDWSEISMPRQTFVFSMPLEVAPDKKQISLHQSEEAIDQKKSSFPEQGTTSQEQDKDATDKKKTNSTEQGMTSKVAADKNQVSSPEQYDKKTSSPSDKKEVSSQDRCNTSKNATEQKQKRKSSPKQCTTSKVAGDQTNDCSTTDTTNESPSFAEALQSNQYHIKWTSCNDLPNKLYNASVAVSSTGDTVYVSAWDAPDKNTECNVYCYTIKYGRWTVLPRPQHRRGTLCMLDNQLTIIGGDNPFTKEALNKVTTYNSVYNSWSRYYPNMLSKRFKPGVITYGNYVIVMGGKNGKDTVYNSIEVMDFRNLQTWKAVSAYLPVPMWNIKPVISVHNISIVGFSIEERRNEYYQIPVETIISSLHQPFFSITKWRRLLPTARYETTTVPYSNPPVTIGGISRTYRGSMLTSDVTLYDASKNSWRKVDSLTSARDCVGVGLINDTTIIVIGGTRGGDGVKAAKATSLTTVEIGTIVPTSSNHIMYAK